MNYAFERTRGVLAGVGLGGLSGLGVCIWLLDTPVVFSGDTMLLGAVLLGTCGWFWGDDFIEWVKEHGWWFP